MYALSLAAVAAIVGSIPARAQQPARIDTAVVDSIIRHHVAEKRITGVSVGIMQHGAIVFARGYGTADLETRRPVTTSTMFAIGSVSKYFPQLTRAADVTLLDLGGHVSGYRDYYPLDYVNREMARAEPADTIIMRYATRPLDFEP